MEDNKNTATALRKIADWIEANPDFRIGTWESMVVWHRTLKGKEALRAAMRAFGGCEKLDSEPYYFLQKDFGGVSLHAFEDKSAVCEIVGTEKKTRKVKKPADPNVQMIEVDEEYEAPIWKCPESLLDNKLNDREPDPNIA
ncbi:MAG: hypothetical protein V1850_02620 [Candidatus Bathyarchaeota archaeon]